jgi:hypothetical protein
MVSIKKILIGNTVTIELSPFALSSIVPPASIVHPVTEPPCRSDRIESRTWVMIMPW